MKPSRASILYEVDCFELLTSTGHGPRKNTWWWCGQSVKILIMIAASEAAWNRERPNLRKTSCERKGERRECEEERDCVKSGRIDVEGRKRKEDQGNLVWKLVSDSLMDGPEGI